MDIDLSLRDFMEREKLAQIVVCHLLNAINHLHDKLACKRSTQLGLKSQLVAALHKCPALPPNESAVDEEPHQPKHIKSFSRWEDSPPLSEASSSHITRQLPLRVREILNPMPSISTPGSTAPSWQGGCTTLQAGQEGGPAICPCYC
jgi:hypothetical protein